MLISALCDYYDILMKAGKVMTPGYSPVDITWLIALNEDGTLSDIIDYRLPEEVILKGKKDRIKTVWNPRRESFPQRESKSAINSELLDHRAEYIFGLEIDKSKSSENFFSVSGIKHQKYVEKNLSFIDGLHSPLIDAYRLFLQNWDPEAEKDNRKLTELKADFTRYYAFCLSGSPHLLQDEPEIKNKWEEMIAGAENTYGKYIAQCSVTGDILPIAKLHNKITGIRGAQSSGAGFISFNNASESSYGREQSYNSCISEQAMLKYTEALRYLLENEKHHTMIDDVHVIHWAASGDEEYDDIFNLFTVSDTVSADNTDSMLSQLFKSAADGRITVDTSAFDPNVIFYIAGFKPNASRLSLKFIYRQQFGKIIENVRQHIEDMQLGTAWKQVPIWRLKKELISPKSSNETVDPALAAKLMEAIVMGTRYPQSLCSTLVKRIKTDCDEENNKYIKMNDIRIGMLKACINRNQRLSGKKEEIQVALDTENRNPAYICGRLFYVLEEIQQKASNYSLNRTIKDAYFSSAVSRPAVIFPNLLKLSMHHIAKLGDSDAKYREQDKAELIAMLNGKFPTTLSLAEQGDFIIGYYQQMQYVNEKIRQFKQKEEN